MNFINDNFKVSIDNNKEYKEAMKQFGEDVREFGKNFHDDVHTLSNWGHQYFCNDDGGRLIFDVAKPKEHVCCVCGKVYKGQPYDGVWTFMYRNAAIDTALKAGSLYAYTKDTQYQDIAMKIIGFYSDNYKDFPLHTKEDAHYKTLEEMTWGCGKIMPQGLNESIIGIRIIQTLSLIKDERSLSFIEGVKKNLLLPMVDLLKPQVDKIHNIRVWNLAAIGAIALFTGNTDLYAWCYNSEFGIVAQLSKGVTKDGFWYEGSIHYNFFLLEGMVTLLMISEVYGKPFEAKEKEIISNMLIRAYMYAFDNDTLPNPNDGWPNLNLKTYSYIYHLAARAFGENSAVGNLVKVIESGKKKRTTLPLSESIYSKNGLAFERLVYNTDFDYNHYTRPARGNYNFALSNFSMLRKDKMNLFMKYGLNGPSHAHPDILNIEIARGEKLISRDISNAGYQSTLCNKWHRMTLCHNTVLCGGKNIESRTPGQATMTDNCIDAQHKDIYAHVDYERKCVLGKDSVTDTFSVTSNNTETKDYVFHLEAGFALKKDVTVLEKPQNLGYSDNGYQYLEDIKMVEYHDQTFTFSDGELELALQFEGPKDGKLYLLKTMDNPVTTKRLSFIFRSKEMKPQYTMHMTCKEK